MTAVRRLAAVCLHSSVYMSGRIYIFSSIIHMQEPHHPELSVLPGAPASYINHNEIQQLIGGAENAEMAPTSYWLRTL